ncbi:tRNA (adenosine(37)-N6)-dimethylallyltransferase MiaA [Pedobacter xixiisoli]|uniref:tRNA dimethylallyltransferase n=1 Tax=Pedobacter xixiisoli TaxID=1476464 RepID=A0A285ZXJ1_9SPHI|nr:tRNA (adenosine(37)-N6)-dimethylallyltransferase MiaA [Pedobacter xixiisoli]SOD14384.1 tRNA dimethylallyltransferase [Pedobacter xixiisoli]
MSDKNLLIVLGATAVGKTRLAVQLAKEFDGEIISADSRQVFKGMDIGTGKDLSEYEIEGFQIPYHLIDIKQAGERYQVNAFKEDFYQAFQVITHQQKLPILCGGTGMYIHSLLQNHELTAIPVNEELRKELLPLHKEGLRQKLESFPLALRKQADESSSKRLIRAIEIAYFLSENGDFTVEERPALKPLVIGLYNDVDTRRRKIISRLEARLANGLIEEVQSLRLKGVSEEMLVFYGLEYKFVIAYLNNEINLDTLKERLGTAICQFAKRQMTFFRKMEKDGVLINWIEAKEENAWVESEALKIVEQNFY